jgi:hypothetical protein
MRMYVIGEAYYFVLGGNHRLSVVTPPSVACTFSHPFPTRSPPERLHTR